jgi:hypothetical protein
MNSKDDATPAPVHRLVGRPIYSWDDATIDAYKPLADATGWEQCPNCHEYPRVWVFDNGNYAKCRCHYKYEGCVFAESIIDACVVRKVPYEEWLDYLRLAWNAHCQPNAQITGPKAPV